MKAIVRDKYGSPDVLKLDEMEIPAPSEKDVLLRIRAASVHAGDWHLMRGTPFVIRLVFGGLFNPRVKVLGTDMAGEVEAIGSQVTQFKPGDAVFADLSACGFGAFAEYVVVPETAVAPKPSNLSFEAAATVPVSGIAALQALRDQGQLQSGQQVLINGASGGVGSYAVQLAKVMGAEVTAVCSTSKLAMVSSLGADHLIDYLQEDPTQTVKQYDLIVDAAAYRSVTDYQTVLKPTGTYVLVGGSSRQLFQTLLLSPWLTRRMHRSIKVLQSEPNRADLMELKRLIEAGQVKPAVDQSYPLRQVPQAIRQLEARQVKGKLAIVV